MATSSFMKEFAVTKINAAKYAHALSQKKETVFSISKKTTEVKKENLKAFLQEVVKWYGI